MCLTKAERLCPCVISDTEKEMCVECYLRMKKGGIEEESKMGEGGIEKILTDNHNMRKSLLANCVSENTWMVAQAPKFLTTTGVFPYLYQ